MIRKKRKNLIVILLKHKRYLTKFILIYSKNLQELELGGNLTNFVKCVFEETATNIQW